VRVIQHAPSPGQLYPLPATRAGEAYVADWCRQIATSVADALNTRATDISYRLTLREDTPVPYLLHTAFTVDGHHVCVAVVWDDPWHEPGFALAVDGTPVPIDISAPAAPAAVLAHAAWQAIVTCAGCRSAETTDPHFTVTTTRTA
jgi:hypothetical protein